MIVELTMAVRLHLPEGSASMDMQGARGWVLPNGDFVKVWASAELNDERDLSFAEGMALGVTVQDIITDVEIVENDCAHTFVPDSVMINVCTQCGMEGEA